MSEYRTKLVYLTKFDLLKIHKKSQFKVKPIRSFSRRYISLESKFGNICAL